MDIENNEVLKMLRFTALAIRESQLVYGSNMDVYKQDPKQRGYYLQYHFGATRPNNGTDLKAEEILKEEVKSMPRLVDATAWEKWKEIARMTAEEHFDTALFLYCALGN
ncbi:unnamed protein product, partial [Mesorhabditis belari]|uniref:Uncharacterized protein n=1 Tax=Mesorhabditis belari TaxID=2138241 RepID=A0AAF3JCA1_9BILA